MQQQQGRGLLAARFLFSSSSFSFFSFFPYFSPLSTSFSFSYVSEGVSVTASGWRAFSFSPCFFFFFFFSPRGSLPFPRFVHAVLGKEGVYADETSLRPRVNDALTIVTCASKLSTC